MGAKERLSRCRALESLVWPDEDVVRECDIEPSLQVLDGQGAVEAEVCGRGEALTDAESPDRSREDPASELAAEIGRVVVEVLRVSGPSVAGRGWRRDMAPGIMFGSGSAVQ